MVTDYIKLGTENKELIDYFLNNDLLKPIKTIKSYTKNDPEIFTTRTIKQYKEIYFFFYSKELKISFYPHYHFNNYLHNANDFTVNDAIKTTKEFIEMFEIDFGIDLLDFRVINIEYGLNVISPIDIKYLIGYFSFQGKNKFTPDIEYPYSLKSFSTNKKTGIRNDYKIIKAYGKGLQYPEYCDINTLRFEIKSKEFAYIKTLGIKTIYDLLNIDVYNTLETKTIEEFKEVLILDYNVNTDRLKAKEQTKVREYINPTHWNIIIRENKRNNFKNKVNDYYKIIDKTGNHLKKQLEQILLNKLSLLKTSAISTPERTNTNDAISIVYNSRNCTINETLESSNINTIKNCQITKVNIAMQKDNSIYLSHTGLRYYYLNNKQVYERVRRKYLSKTWYNTDLETEIKEIAHNIRNASSNQSIRQHRLYIPQQYNLLSFIDS